MTNIVFKNSSLMSEEELSFQGDGEYHEKKRRSGDVDYTESQ